MTTKTHLRREALASRAALDAATRAAASEAAARHAVRVLGPAPGVVALFFSIRDEIDTRPLARDLASRGIPMALPVVVGRGRPLLFRRWRPGDTLASRPFGLFEPPATSPAIEPDVLIVPLAAFDRSGARIGYGAGHYDVTLADLRARRSMRAIGYAFAVQEVPHIPTEAHDEPLDLIVSEAGVIAPAPVACAS